MICPRCETEASGNFCANCGHKLFLGHCSNCRKEVFSNYCAHCGALFNQHSTIRNVKKLVLQPEFRNLIRIRRGSAANPRLTQNFFDQMDLAFASMNDFEVKKLKDVLEHVHKESNMNEARAITKTLDFAFDQVVAKTLCVLAMNTYLIDSAKDAQNGLLIIAIVPSDMSIWGGVLLIAIEKDQRETNLTINARIRGQAQEIEQSRRIIKRFFTEIEEMALENLNSL